VKSAGGNTLMATRLLDQPNSVVLSGTESAEQPFFSPDGQWIGFFAGQKLKKISVLGGAAVTLCATTGIPRGAWWGDDGSIIAELDNVTLFRVPEGGGEPQLLGKPSDHVDRTWRWPQVLPGGKMVLMTARGGPNFGTGAGYDDATIDILSLQSGQVKVVHRGGYFGRYLPSGHLTYIHQGTLFAVPFDLGRLEIRGIPVPVVEEVAAAPAQGGGQLDFSNTGTLIYLRGKANSTNWSIVWMDSSGKTESLLTTSGTGAALTPRFSPNGKLLAYASSGDILVYDPTRAATTKLTFTGAPNRQPVWMPDNKHIVYGAAGGSDPGLWWVRSDASGQPQKLFASKDIMAPTSTTPDGRRVAFSVARESLSDIWTIPLDLTDPDHPKPGAAEPFLNEPAGQAGAAFSPDGRWMAYQSLKGNPQIFVTPFPGGPARGKWLISNAGGRFPVWSQSRRELFYVSPDDRIMVVSYSDKGDSFLPDKPRQWSPTPILNTGIFWNFDVAPDGKRLAVLPIDTGTEDKGNLHLTVLLNFFDELRRRVK